MRYRRVISVPVVILAVAFAGLCVTAAVTISGGPSLRAAEDGGRALPVEARPVRYQNHYRTLEAFAGKAVARRTSDLGFERGGLLAEVLVDEGDEVRTGQPLARLDRRQLEARREELASRLELARVTAQRRRDLLKRKNVSEQSYDEARLEAAATAASLKAVEVQIDLAELKAPYDAVIVDRLADEGTVTGPGQAILRVIERNAWEARIGLPPATAARLKPGQEVKLSIEGGEFAGTLRKILPRIDQNTRTALALFDIEDPEGRLRSGALARVRIETVVRERGFWLPVTALTEGRRGLWTAYVIGPSKKTSGGEGRAGLAERRQLQIIHTETDRAYVRGAVNEGEYVITAGVHRIVPGQAVEAVGAVSGR